MLEDVIDSPDGAAHLEREVAGLQGRETLFGDRAFCGIDQVLAQRGVPVRLLHGHPFLNGVQIFC